jgi:ketosteroid isomerase-like protein
MYKAIVRRRARAIFANLSRGDWQALMRDTHPHVHHVFPGDNALGGERHTREAMARWFERVFRLFPSLEFEVQRVAVDGWPWDTAVAVEWTEVTTPAAGEPYSNEGTHWIRLRWGKATYVHAYIDTKNVTEACERMAAAGIEEAAAAPITG